MTKRLCRGCLLLLRGEVLLPAAYLDLLDRIDRVKIGVGLVHGVRDSLLDPVLGSSQPMEFIRSSPAKGRTAALLCVRRNPLRDIAEQRLDLVEFGAPPLQPPLGPGDLPVNPPDDLFG